ncbi:MAG: LytS/YhcK type 5TM receptor domain-containing protein, partial [Calditrichaceae bacterium]
MNLTIFTGLVNNAALLFTIALLYDLLEIKTQEKRSLIRQYLAGLIIGIAGIVIMLNPLDFGNGVIFDTRSVLLCVAGLFFGPVPTVTSMLMVSAFRIYMGGGGLWMGVGVIISSGSIGLVWRHFRNTKKDDPSVGELYLFGLVVHMVMVLWMFILPKNVITAAFAKIAPPVMIIYPLATAVIGKLIINRKKRIQVRDELGKSEEKFRNLFHYHSAVKLLIDPDTGDITDANLAAEKFYGWKVEELKQMHIQDINTIPPDQIKLEIEKVRSSQRTHFEFQHRLADGSVRDVEVYSSRVLVDNKIYLHSIVHDITDRRLAENALLKSKERLNFALHMSKTGGWEMDLTALTITCTREFDRIFGYDYSTITWSYKTFMDHIF